MSDYHKSVLLTETIDQLNVEFGKRYIDGTLGGGGHTSAILDRGGEVLGIDFDEDALDYVKKELGNEKKLILARGNFKDIDIIAKENGFEKVAGVLFDLGVSSHHFDDAERGFSFLYDATLDMRMDRNLSVKAKDLVNGLTKGELYELFYKYGEERFARPISEGIVSARKVKPIETTATLAEIIKNAVRVTKPGIHPATQSFQALRIAVNDELNSLRQALPKAVELLESRGRLAVISFHSLEDRIVKKYFLEFEEKGLGKNITKKPIVPSEKEININNRARSAKLRVFEKL